MQKKPYEMPEILELGPAAALTQGAKGCKSDGTACEKNSSDDVF